MDKCLNASYEANANSDLRNLIELLIIRALFKSFQQIIQNSQRQKLK